jgi:hypothetical protein
VLRFIEKERAESHRDRKQIDISLRSARIGAFMQIADLMRRLTIERSSQTDDPAARSGEVAPVA